MMKKEKETKMLSDCCGVVVRFQDICSRCGEHCEVGSDDGYDAARDAYNEGYGPPVTSRQRREEQEEYNEYRRNGY
jgi:hypothetical protein